MILKGKVAVVYGAGGAIGSAVARGFAREGASLFVTGRHRPRVDAVAKEIVAAGGSAEPAQVDSLNEGSVEGHLRSVVEKASRIDISFNAVGIPSAGVQGVPMVDLKVDQFSLPISTLTRSNFLTARHAARVMVPRKSGVIMSVTSIMSRTGIPNVGGLGPAMSAQECLTRELSAELAAHGIRVVGLRVQGMPETATIKEAFDLHSKALGISPEQFQGFVASRTHTQRLPTLAELVDVAAFMASDEASAVTGSVVNLSMGSLDD
jgi:NAD(P)-dependent dehydrogenase (short-subunit alcohol dehydrogenase family)